MSAMCNDLNRLNSSRGLNPCSVCATIELAGDLVVVITLTVVSISTDQLLIAENAKREAQKTLA